MIEGYVVVSLFIIGKRGKKKVRKREELEI